MENKMEQIREKLNAMLESEEYTSQEILDISQELDKLIVWYYSSKTNDDDLES